MVKKDSKSGWIWGWKQQFPCCEMQTEMGQAQTVESQSNPSSGGAFPLLSADLLVEPCEVKGQKNVYFGKIGALSSGGNGGPNTTKLRLF